MPRLAVLSGKYHPRCPDHPTDVFHHPSRGWRRTEWRQRYERWRRSRSSSTVSFTLDRRKTTLMLDLPCRYLNQGKRHTVCEQGLLLGGKARRVAGARESVKERGLASRRASDTSSNFINSSARAHLERLYHNAVNSKATDDDDLTASSLQELQKLQKQVQKVGDRTSVGAALTFDFHSSIQRAIPRIPRCFDGQLVSRLVSCTERFTPVRSILAVPSPTNSLGLHRIQEENQRNPRMFLTGQRSDQNQSSSSSSEGLANGDDDDHGNEMDCDVQMQHPAQLPPIQERFRPPYFHPPPPPSFFCNTSPLLAQHLAIPTTTSSYMPWSDEHHVHYFCVYISIYQ